MLEAAFCVDKDLDLEMSREHPESQGKFHLREGHATANCEASEAMLGVHGRLPCPTLSSYVRLKLSIGPFSSRASCWP